MHNKVSKTTHHDADITKGKYLGDTPLNVPHIAWFSYQVL
jgi:hypothetical protein